MTEMQSALKTVGAIQDAFLIEFSPGCWVFRGRVPAALCYEAKDGTPATQQQMEDARSFGPRLAGVRSRSWTTREDAVAAAEMIGASFK
jgi:hypothetical protein